MELYFGSLQGLNNNREYPNLVTFVIPDIGVKFKAPYPAENMTLEYASLLTLLEFVEVNPQLFTNRALELFSHNAELVDQIKKNKVDNRELVPLLQKALEYRSKLNYSINWIPGANGGQQS
jgi:hypothetical protein